MEKIDWFVENYIENKEQCEFLLEQAEKKYSFTKKQFYEGCYLLRLGRFDKDLLETHIKLLGEMSNVGIKAAIAGAKLREAFLESEKNTKS
jgi:hypothetical protein